MSAVLLKIAGGESESVPLKLSRPLQYISRKGESLRTEQKISLKKFEYAPIEENTVVGSVELIIDGNVVDRSEILTAGSDTKDCSQRTPKRKKPNKKVY